MKLVKGHNISLETVSDMIPHKKDVHLSKFSGFSEETTKCINQIVDMLKTERYCVFTFDKGEEFKIGEYAKLVELLRENDWNVVMRINENDIFYLVID